jgi:ABC-type glutathione transport system ATPase component
MTAPADGAAIRTNGLTRTFGRFTAVDHITFDVRPGEVFGFLGANGAGKTTGDSHAHRPAHSVERRGLGRRPRRLSGERGDQA